MLTIYHVVLCDDEVGEVEGFFDESGSLLATWSLNDANWRNEYHNSLIEALGIRVEQGGSGLEALLKAEWEKYI